VEPDDDTASDRDHVMCDLDTDTDTESDGAEWL